LEKSLLDTDILSESRKRIDQRVVAKARAYLDIFGQYTISVITVTEVVKGWHRRQQEAAIGKFLADIDTMEVLPVKNTSIAELAGRIYGDLERTGQAIGLADSIIAAIAIHYDLTLVTGNLSHYQRIEMLGYRLKLDNWRL
jgi:tRNA(fMet)-specific endonuclease VapC